MDGLLIVDKPEGMTSAQVVSVVKHRLRIKTGHLGTLDPFASGVLPLCLGAGTKIAQFLNTADKAYTGAIRLGSQTDTGDPTGSVIRTAAVPTIAASQLVDAARRFCGDLLQVPPMYSAVKQGGRALYTLARQGITVSREARAVHISELTLARCDAHTLTISVACSKGTYIRVLAEEIAAALGTVGHLLSLRRTRFGAFDLESATPLEQVSAHSVRLINLRDSLRELREIQLEESSASRARHGYEPVLVGLAPGTRGEAAKLISPDGELAAIVVMHESGRWRFARVFAEQSIAT